MKLEEQLLATSIRNTLRDGDRAVYKLFHLEEGNTADNVEVGDHANDLHEAQVTLRFLVEKAYRDIGILAERLGLPMFCADIASSLASFADLAKLEPTPWDIIHHSPSLGRARVLFQSLAVMTEGREVTGLGVFETVLGNTPKIIARAGLPPKNEAQVRQKVREVLEICFTDVRREIPIPKNIKTYKPDIGVESLMAAAEYKFIDSFSEAKKALEEVYADMHGYRGHPDWRSFYAVFYMTGPFYTQKEVDEEFRLVKADLSWTPLVLVGPGARRSPVKRTSSAKKKASKTATKVA